MPKKIEPFRPPWAAQRPREARPTAAARGYCSANWARLRKQAIARDGGICRICGKLIVGRIDVDHIVPKAAGGRDELANLQSCHAACHSRKTAMENR